MTEKSFKYNGNSFRFDIYGILSTTEDNLLYEFAIEFDEKHHDIKRQQERDKQKNKYCITNGISLMRIRSNAYTPDILSKAISFIKSIIKTQLPQYKTYNNISKPSKSHVIATK
jgi:hypothetical protein